MEVYDSFAPYDDVFKREDDYRTLNSVPRSVVGQIVQYLLTGDCSVTSRSYLIDMELLAIREGVRL